jgi:hypothetical protein
MHDKAQLLMTSLIAAAICGVMIFSAWSPWWVG